MTNVLAAHGRRYLRCGSWLHQHQIAGLHAVPTDSKFQTSWPLWPPLPLESWCTCQAFRPWASCLNCHHHHKACSAMQHVRMPYLGWGIERGGRETEREMGGGGGGVERENSNSKNFNTQGLLSIWTDLTASPCYTINTKHDYITNIYKQE